MYFLVLLNSVFVFYFFVRELRNKTNENHFSRGKLTKIGILFCCFQFLNFIFFLKYNFLFLFLLLSSLPHFFLFSGDKIKTKINEKRFRTEFYHFIKDVTLGMRVGNSFRSSLSEAYHLLSPKNKTRVQMIVDLVVFSQHKKLDPKSDIDREIYNEFSQIDKSSHQALQRLDLWVQKIERNNEFRHKSGQVLHQLYIQTAILLAMYLALFFVVVGKYGFLANFKIIGLSLFLFLTGSFLCFKVGKKIKWNF